MASAQTLLDNLLARRGKSYFDEIQAALQQIITDYATVADRFIATSTSTVTVGAGSKTFTLSTTGKSMAVGSSVMAYSTSDPTVYMIGRVASFSDPTLTLSVDAADVSGSGSVSAWTIVLSAAPSPLALPSNGAGQLTGPLNFLNSSLTSRVTVGTAQAATSTTITLDAGNQEIDDIYNGLDVVITGGTGAGQTRTITNYVGSTREATISPAWTTTPGTSPYDIRIPAGSNGNGQKWRWIVKDWTSNIGNGGGGRFVLEVDTSDTGDWSSSEEVQSMSINSGPGMNGNDGEMYLHQQVVHIISTNDLRNPPMPQNNDVVSGASKTGTSSSPLDVGPQWVLHRDVTNPPAGSTLGQFMFTGNSDTASAVRYAELVLEVRDPTSTNPKGRLRTQVATAPTFGGGSKSAWSVGSDGCTTWKPSGGADTQPTGGEKGEGTINAFALYDDGNRVAVTTSANQPVLTTTGATNVTLPTTGTLATLSGTETLSNKTLASPALTGTLTGGTLNPTTYQVGGTAMFESGTWTPVLAGASTAGTNTYSTASGYYERHNDLVFVRARIGLSSKDAAMAGGLRITGLPFTAASTGSVNNPAALDLINGVTFPGGYSILTGAVVSNTARMELYVSGSGVGVTNLVPADISSSFIISISAVYRKA